MQQHVCRQMSLWICIIIRHVQPPTTGCNHCSLAIGGPWPDVCNFVLLFSTQPFKPHRAESSLHASTYSLRGSASCNPVPLVSKSHEMQHVMTKPCTSGQTGSQKPIGICNAHLPTILSLDLHAQEPFPIDVCLN